VRLYLPASLGFLPRRMAFSTWVDHLPFGYDIVAALRPRVLVELGTQAGVSYFCFCQAAAEQGVELRAHAVDTFRGDAHTAGYDERIWNEVSAHNAAHYAGFSTLHRMLFEEAAPLFAPESIDLLHIDGYHTYEAVRADFELWWPRVRPGGLVLLHDVAARILDFGAYRYFAELARDHEAFLFHHGFGLGVVAKPGPRPASPLLEALFSADPEVEDALRRFYVHLAEDQELRRKAARVRALRARGG